VEIRKSFCAIGEDEKRWLCNWKSCKQGLVIYVGARIGVRV
jgi:hypothetical protein